MKINRFPKSFNLKNRRSTILLLGVSFFTIMPHGFASSGSDKLLSCSTANDPYRTEEPDIDWRNYQWILILGNGTTACEEMLGYLKKRPKHLPPPVCPEERLPPNGHWRRPEGRDLSDAEQQSLLDSVPESTRPLFEKEFKDKFMRILHTGIKTDQVQEWYLAYTGEQRFSDVPRNCRLVTQCAHASDKTVGTGKQIVLGSAYSYDIMSM